MDQASEGILKLKPVTCHYKDRDDKNDKTPQFGLIAEDVDPANALELAIVLHRPAGAYTAVVRGANGTTGNALVEVCDLD